MKRRQVSDRHKAGIAIVILSAVDEITVPQCAEDVQRLIQLVRQDGHHKKLRAAQLLADICGAHTSYLFHPECYHH